MSRCLAVIRAIALIGLTLLLCVGFVCTRVYRAGRGEPPGPVADRFVGRWARATRRIIGMRVLVDGEIPQSGVSLVTNHLSYIDIVALWCVVPAVFVARADVAHWPLVGQAARLIGTIFIDRTRKRDLLRVIPEMEARLTEGRHVIFFPEGTSSRGTDVYPFKSSLFEAAARQHVPVVGASLQFETQAPDTSADWSVCWWADMTFPRHVFALLQLSGFDARIRFAPARHVGGDRKVLCRLARTSVQEVFAPSTPVAVWTGNAAPAAFHVDVEDVR